MTPRVAWRDVGGQPQQYRFGGAKHDTPVPVRARSRVLVAEGSGGSIAVFPPPITFFFTREVDTNHGYVWYRKDSDTTFSMGVRQGDGEEVDHYRANFALYNAPPGTWQRMAVYFYASPEAASSTTFTSPSPIACGMPDRSTPRRPISSPCGRLASTSSA